MLKIVTNRGVRYLVWSGGRRVASHAEVRLYKEKQQLHAEVERLKILGPDTTERVTCEARAIAAEMMQPALQAWKEENETLRAEVERLKKRDMNAKVSLLCGTDTDPFRQESLTIVDVGVADNIYVVESKMLLELRAEVERLKKEQEILAWNLAGCDCYARGYDIHNGHNKEMARPALDAVLSLALRADALTAEVERLRGLIVEWCAKHSWAVKEWKAEPWNAALFAEAAKAGKWKVKR